MFPFFFLFISSQLINHDPFHQQIYSFLHDDDTYVDPGSIATAWSAFDPMLRALSMMSRTLSLRKRLLSPSPPLVDDPAEQAAVLQDCFETLDAFHRWDEEAAEYWKTTFEGRAVPTSLGEVAASSSPSSTGVGMGGNPQQYYDVETACTMILTRSERLVLLMSMIAYHWYQDRAGRGAETGLAECVGVLGRHVGMAIDDILASVPYALGDVGPGGVPSSLTHDGAAAIVIVQSIRLVASCALASPAQRRRALDVLARLDGAIGIRAAASSAIPAGDPSEEEGGRGGRRVGGLDEDMARSSWVREQVFLREYLASRQPVVTVTEPAVPPSMPAVTSPDFDAFATAPSSPVTGPSCCWEAVGGGDPFASSYLG